MMSVKRTFVTTMAAAAFALGAVAAWSQFGFMKLNPLPLKQGGQILVPAQQLGDAFKAKLTLSGANISGQLGQHKFAMAVGSKKATLDGKTVQLPVAPRVTNKVVFVPLKEFAQGLGVKVEVTPEHIKLCTDQQCVMIKPPK